MQAQLNPSPNPQFLLAEQEKAILCSLEKGRNINPMVYPQTPRFRLSCAHAEKCTPEALGLLIPYVQYKIPFQGKIVPLQQGS